MKKQNFSDSGIYCVKGSAFMSVLVAFSLMLNGSSATGTTDDRPVSGEEKKPLHHSNGRGSFRSLEVPGILFSMPERGVGQRCRIKTV